MNKTEAKYRLAEFRATIGNARRDLARLIANDPERAGRRYDFLQEVTQAQDARRLRGQTDAFLLMIADLALVAMLDAYVSAAEWSGAEGRDPLPGDGRDEEADNATNFRRGRLGD